MTIKLTVSIHILSFIDGKQLIAPFVTDACSISDAFMINGTIALVNN